MKNKGISLIVLITTIVIMIILVSTLTITGIDTANNAKKMQFASEIRMLEEKVNGYITSNNGELPTGDFVLIDLSDSSVSNKVLEQFTKNSEDIVDGKVSLSMIDYEKLEISNLTYGMRQKGQDDIYAISNKTGKIYYMKGLNIGNNIYYTLTTELENLLKYNVDNDTIASEDSVIFIPDTTNWVNRDVSVKIKVPTKYTNVIVKVEDTVFNKEEPQSQLDYNIYNVIYNGNYTVNVSYLVNGISKEAKFSVLNVDKNIPSFETKKSSTVTNDSYYIQIINIVDNSGIKTIKYDINRIDNNNIGKSYFIDNGKEVVDNLIKLDKSVDYITIYVEDNAGNYLIKQIDCTKL